MSPRSNVDSPFDLPFVEAHRVAQFTYRRDEIKKSKVHEATLVVRVKDDVLNVSLPVEIWGQNLELGRRDDEGLIRRGHRQGVQAAGAGVCQRSASQIYSSVLGSSLNVTPDKGFTVVSITRCYTSCIINTRTIVGFTTFSLRRWTSCAAWETPALSRYMRRTRLAIAFNTR